MGERAGGVGGGRWGVKRQWGQPALNPPAGPGGMARWLLSPTVHAIQPNSCISGCSWMDASLPLCHWLQLLEEAGIQARSMQHCGELHFIFDDQPQPWHVYGACI